MSRRPTKKLCQRSHANTRFAERFGANLPRLERLKIVRTIQEGKAQFVDRQSNRITRWIVNALGQSFCAVYDSKRKEVVTCLPLDFLRNTGSMQRAAVWKYSDNLEHDGLEKAREILTSEDMLAARREIDLAMQAEKDEAVETAADLPEFFQLCDEIEEKYAPFLEDLHA